MQETGVNNETGSVRDIKSMTMEELTALMKENGFPAFRARQLYRWMHVSLVRSYSEMSNIPKAMADKLEKDHPLTAVRMIDRQVSKLDGTQKYLFAMGDNSLVESVFMRYKFGNSVCISSQVGCRMGCRFCASTLDGLFRSLTPSEMLDQIYEIQRVTGERVSHVVVMGTGEPLDNYDNLVRFLRLLTDENGLNISQRNVTVSTCGIVPRIYDLADEKLSITLALSLHAVTDEKRREIMPIANQYSIAELMEAGRYYFDRTGRQVTFEYSLIRDVNDSAQDAQMLAELARPLKAHINLIPVNPVKERGYRQTQDSGVRAFQKKLEKSGINVSIRRVLGRDIDGACGQLRGNLSCLYLVADGMGGHRAGDYASKYTVETVVDHVAGTEGEDPEELLGEAYRIANTQIRLKAARHREFYGMGTTLVSCTICGDMLLVANVGDSRLYNFHRGELTQVTVDHSLVEEMVRAGTLDRKLARIHPERNVITRAIGAEDQVRVDFFRVPLSECGIILMCSDGLTTMVEDEEICEILRSSRDLEEKAAVLVARANNAGGSDNISVILIDTSPAVHRSDTEL